MGTILHLTVDLAQGAFYALAICAKMTHRGMYGSMIKRLTLCAGLIYAIGLGLAAGVLWLLNSSLPAVQARGHDAYAIYYVSPDGDCGVGADPCFSSVQAAVDAADSLAGEEIRVASGVYTDVHQRAGITQVVYLSKPLTIRGGYITGSLTGTAWTSSYPLTQPTTLDAGGQGRVLYITGTISSTIEGLRITGGDARRSGDDAHNGGGIAILGAVAVLNHNHVVGNAARFGGGVHLRLGSTASLHENTIGSNVADHGGGVAVQDSIQVVLEGNAIITNTGHQDGGGMYLSGSDAVLYGNVITSNATAGYGGGVYIYAGDARLDQNTIANNLATIVVDSAGSGGGVAVLNYGNAVLDNNRIIFNTALGDGGGVYILQGEAALERTVIFSNTADNGGGMYVYQGHATLTNTVTAGNRAVEGGGLYLKNSTAQLLHNTVADNAVSGVHVTDLGGWGYSTILFTNTILAGHGAGITVTSGNTATLEATLWYTNAVDWGGAGSVVTGSLNIWGDPAFADPAVGDYHIYSGSFAIDRGVDAGVRSDIDGQPRPAGLGYDLGADELAVVAEHALYLPCILKDQ